MKAIHFTKGLCVLFLSLFILSSCSDDDNGDDSVVAKLEGEWEITSRVISSYNKDWPDDMAESFKNWDKKINGLYQSYGTGYLSKYIFDEKQTEVRSITTKRVDEVLIKDLRESYTIVGKDSIVVRNQGLGEITRQGKYYFSGENSCQMIYSVDETSIRLFLEEIGVDPQLPNGTYPYYATIRYNLSRK